MNEEMIQGMIPATMAIALVIGYLVLTFYDYELHIKWKTARRYRNMAKCYKVLRDSSLHRKYVEANKESLFNFSYWRYIKTLDRDEYFCNAVKASRASYFVGFYQTVQHVRGR